MIHPGLVSITFRKLSPEEIVALVRTAGLKGIEWGGDIHVPHGEVGRAREVRDVTQDAGLTVSAYGSYFRVGHSENNGLPFNQVLASALELAAPVIRVWAGSVGSAAVDEDGRWRIVEDLRRITDLAAKAGVKVAVEFHGGTLADTHESTSQLLVEVDRPNLHTYWQPLIGMTDEVCVHAIRELAPRLSHLHVFHWETVNQRQPLAVGADRWRKILQTAAQIGGDRYAMLEYVEHDTPESFRRDAATLIGLLKEL